MRLFWLACLCMAMAFQPLMADTIFETNSEGNEIALQRNAIVTRQDSSFVVYKHFDLKERRVTVVRLNRGSLPIRVEPGDAAARAQIVNIWRSFGYKATITDNAGKVTGVADLYLDFYPPGGRGSLLESVPARTNFPLITDGAGAEEIEFGKIDRLEIQGETLTVILRSGKTVTGKFVMPTSRPAEVRVLGITGNYNPASEEVFDYSVPLTQLKLISFQ